MNSSDAEEQTDSMSCHAATIWGMSHHESMSSKCASPGGDVRTCTFDAEENGPQLLIDAAEAELMPLRECLIQCV